MLGSAIPRRWVVSLALVGLVSLFAASYSAAWANPASATTGTTGTTAAATPTPTPVPADTTLASIEALGTGSITLPPNSSVSFSIIAKNSVGTDISSSAPGLTYAWAVTNSCGTFDNATAAAVILTSANAGCSGTIGLQVKQFGANPKTESISLTVNAPAVPVVVVPVSNSAVAAVLPTGVDSSIVTEIKASDGGSLSVDGGDGKAISLTVPGGSLGDGEAASVSIKLISSGAVPSAPPAATEGASSGTFKFGSSVVLITWYDKDGSAQDTKKISKPAQVCMSYTPEDIANADGGIDGLGVWRHNGTDWINLNSNAFTNPNRICAYTQSFSPFALGLDIAAPGAASAVATGLPATGGYSPSSMTLLLAMFSGFALVGTGVVAARRARRAGEHS
jgi:hypothetical protein